MEDIHEIRNRTFSFGAHGYNQDDVDRYLRELADRIESGDADWDAELDRFEQRSFAVVSLGYWRPDVDSYMAELGAWLSDRAGARTTESQAPEEGPEPVEEPEAESTAAAMPSGWAQGIVERLRRVTEASTAPTTLADVTQDSPEAEEAVEVEEAEQAEEAVPEIVAAAPLRLADDAEDAPDTGRDYEAHEPLDREPDRARLFRMAMALGVEDAISMTAAELVAAIDRADGGEEPEAPEPAGEPAEDANAALVRTKATLASFERMLADQVSQVTAAARLERESAAREAEEMLHEAERRASQILAAAEREGDALGERAQRYSERVRRLADREVLRKAAAAEPVATVAVAELEPEPEPEAVEPEPEAVEPEPEAVEPEPEPETEPEAVEPEPEPELEPASAWGRLRRMLG